ncbi:MAG: Gfo/Idh/MocA family oxidoreductase [Nocardioidaceae bacterium]|jgi:predicted dehydrogenase|nr:Gfo/Idh/MocA family oxidoreductase [Nocardioidaceae bacterium]
MSEDRTLEEPEQRPIRWGILATGQIARNFADDLSLLPDAELSAVGSRSHQGAETFAHQHGVRRAYGSYEQLAADAELDVVYVATPHSRHAEDVMTCFEAGKSVLCEKALTLDADTSAELVGEARARGLFFAEAMWMRTIPAIRKAVTMAQEGHCGHLRQVRADLGFMAPYDPTSRLWDPALGASALLDVGIYPLTLAHLVLGPPLDVSAAAVVSQAGADINGGATLTYASGAVASLSWTQTACSPAGASIAGDTGRIELPTRFHHCESFSYVDADQVRTFSEPISGRGYVHEAQEVHRCLREGLTESGLLPLDETVDIMRVMDRIRACF